MSTPSWPSAPRNGWPASSRAPTPTSRPPTSRRCSSAASSPGRASASGSWSSPKSRFGRGQQYRYCWPRPKPHWGSAERHHCARLDQALAPTGEADGVQVAHSSGHDDDELFGAVVDTYPAAVVSPATSLEDGAIGGR